MLHIKPTMKGTKVTNSVNLSEEFQDNLEILLGEVFYHCWCSWAR